MTDRKPFEWLNEDSRKFLSRGYLLEGVTPEQRIRQIADRAQELLPKNPGFADKFYEYMSYGWFSLSSPVWSNFGLGRGLPVSCFGSTSPDSMEGILGTAAEIGMMSKHGGGTAVYMGGVRGRGAPIRPTKENPEGENGQSEGAVNFLRLFDTLIDVSKQGGVRRGSTAAYLPIDHDDIEEFLQIKDAGNQIQNLFTAVTVKDDWMQDMIAGNPKKRKIWAKVLEARSEKGVPYIFFHDNVNRNKPQVYKDKGMEINHSQLCSEILLPTNDDESFVCVLSSMNLLHYEEWKDTDAVEVLTMFLDAVVTEFIDKAKDIAYFDRAVRFAEKHRALGLGVLGWHSFLQSKMIPFESLEADLYNRVIFKQLEQDTKAASRKLAELYGEPEVMLGYGMRNTTTMAVAPTTSSSYILGQVSSGIEPIDSNYHIKNLAKVTSVYKNPYLEKLLEEKGWNDQSTWDSILSKDGSVQHLKGLTEHERNVFKTFGEINMYEVINQQAVRQKFMDQTSSLNIKIHPDTPAREINKLHIHAWEKGICTLYYQHSISAAKLYNQSLLDVSCVACEG